MSNPVHSTAADYAASLLAGLGVDGPIPVDLAPEHPAISWAQSGAMALTGRADGPPRICVAPVAACADGVLAALAALTASPALAGLRGSHLLSERAAIFGYGRNGAISPSGTCRLLRATDGWIALNLARPDDWQMLPALLGREIAPDWESLSNAVLGEQADMLVDQGRTLGLAIAFDQHHPHPTLPHQGGGLSFMPLPLDGGGGVGVMAPDRAGQTPDKPSPLVVDLSSLWAGPLCGHLLDLAGARVIKVESLTRPDGARLGPAAFFDLMNGGKQSVALDFATPTGRSQLRQLLARADIVIEASRPRALAQLGIVAEELVAEHPGQTWVSITGYGRTGDAGTWIAFGDDAGVSGGLSTFLRESAGSPIFCADAIADPLTGLHAALIAWQHWQSGVGGLVSVAMCDVVTHCAGFDGPASIDEAAQREAEWSRILDQRRITAAPPRARPAPQSARPLGADTAAVLSEFGISC